MIERPLLFVFFYSPSFLFGFGIRVALLAEGKRNRSTEQAAGTGTALRPMKDLLPHYDTVEDARAWNREGEQHISVGVENGHRPRLCELVGGLIQLDG